MSQRASETCISCGLSDERVEAGGVHHCPNPVCTVTGAEWARRSLKSYRQNRDDTHSIDTDELLAVYLPDLLALAPDAPMRLAAERSVERWNAMAGAHPGDRT